MAIKFPRVRPDDGEVIHPDDLVENLGEFINEINGNLDSDNFKDEIPSDHFSSNCFTEIHKFRTDGPFFQCSDKTTSYIKTDSSNNQLAGVVINADTDGWAIIDFNANFVWTGSGLTSQEMADDVQQAHVGGDGPLHGFISAFGNYSRMDMPAGGWMGICGEDDVKNIGTFPDFDNQINDAYGFDIGGLSAGNFPMGQWSDLPTDMYVVQFKISVNGNVVSESGYLFNGNWRNSVYLCGVTPIVAGRNAIDVEVRSFTAFKLKTSRTGVGARDSDDRRGENYSFQIESSEFHPIPLPKFEKDGLTIKIHPAMKSNVKDTTFNFDSGIKCEIRSRNLLVQLRKR